MYMKQIEKEKGTKLNSSLTLTQSILKKGKEKFNCALYLIK